MVVNNEFTRYKYLDAEGRLTELALYQLSKPFDTADIKWLPQDVKRDKKTALALAYADPRVYHERLDRVFGPANWSTDIEFVNSPFHKIIPEKKDYKTQEVIAPEREISGYMLYAIARLSVAGLGTKTSTGECDTSDGNAATSSEAQAFKRACSMLTIGRYLYFLDKFTCGYDYGKFTELPKLPPWAIPAVDCADSGFPITDFTFINKKQVQETWPASKVLAKSIKLFGVPLRGQALMERSRNKTAASGEAA